MILVLGMVILIGTYQASAQSFLSKIKSAAEKTEKAVKDVSNTVDSYKRVKNEVENLGKDISKEASDIKSKTEAKGTTDTKSASNSKSSATSNSTSTANTSADKSSTGSNATSTAKTSASSKSSTSVKGSSSAKTSAAPKQSARDRELQKQHDAMVGKGANKNAEDEAPTVRLPKTHTALFAPLGYPIEANYGVKSAKPVMPPRKDSDQVSWSDKLPAVSDLDNQSLVAEYIMLDQCAEDGYIGTLSPAYWRYDNLVKEELLSRIGALNDMVELYNEAMDEYKVDDTYNWVINGIHRRLVAVLEGTAYKTVMRSSLTPLFTLKKNFVNKATKEYFAAFGGYENAIKATMTVWDPEPNKETVSTTESGQTGIVIDENASGATVDLGGVIYVLHNKNGKPSKAFISEVVSTAVAGKDIVIPDNVVYKGKNYPVREMRGDIFRGTAIKSVKLPSTLSEISNAAFRQTQITEITIPASVKIIQGSAFSGCTKLAKVVFEGDEMDELHGCFQNCTSLRSIKFPSRVGLMSYDMFSGCTNLTDVTLPENLTEIYDSMFAFCKSLKTLNVPSTVVKVGSEAFSDSGITELDLSNVKEFGDGCFFNCKSLKTVKLNSSFKENFLMDFYDKFMGCPLMQVKYENNQYVMPAGLIFVDGK